MDYSHLVDLSSKFPFTFRLNANLDRETVPVVTGDSKKDLLLLMRNSRNFSNGDGFALLRSMSPEQISFALFEWTLVLTRYWIASFCRREIVFEEILLVFDSIKDTHSAGENKSLEQAFRMLLSFSKYLSEVEVKQLMLSVRRLCLRERFFVKMAAIHGDAEIVQHILVRDELSYFLYRSCLESEERLKTVVNQMINSKSIGEHIFYKVAGDYRREDFQFDTHHIPILRCLWETSGLSRSDFPQDELVQSAFEAMYAEDV